MLVHCRFAFLTGTHQWPTGLEAPSELLSVVLLISIMCGTEMMSSMGQRTEVGWTGARNTKSCFFLNTQCCMNCRYKVSWVLPRTINTYLALDPHKASLRVPQGPEAVKSTKGQDFPLGLSMRLQKDKYHLTWLYMEMLKKPEQNIFSVSPKGKMQSLICKFSVNIISNWRINICTIMGYPTMRCDHKHRKNASMMWHFSCSFLNQRWSAVV